MMILFSFFLSLNIFAQDIILYPGASATIPVTANSVTVEKKGIVAVTDQGNKLKIIGKKSGHTAIHIGNQKHSITVLKENTFETYSKLLKWSKNRKGPILTIEDQKIYIRGEFLTYIDWLELSQFMNEGDDFTIQAKVDEDSKGKVNAYLKQISEKNNLPFSDLNTLPNWEISLSNTQQNNISVYKKIFSPYGIKINQSSFAISNIPMIEITILAAEIKRSELSQLGVNWPKATSFQVVPKLSLDPNSLLVSIDHLEQNGWGKVLASPTLLTQSGETASFHSGGEFPIKTSNQYNASVTWKQYGILMKIKPKADFTGKMDVQIECEVSAIDTKTIDNVPGLLINRISSHFNLNESRTIALSGLLREEWDHNRQGLPGLSELPLFGSLFSSQNYRNNQSELVFFVTPRIVR